PSPARPNGACAAIRTPPIPAVGVARTFSTSTPRPPKRLPMELHTQSGNVGQIGNLRPIGNRSDRRRKLLGFTFVELMVVIAIIVILISMAIPIYSRSIMRAKESVLKNNLFTLRTVIDNYTYD